MTAPTATIIGPLVYPGNATKVAARSIRFRPVGPDGVVLRDSDGALVGETVVFTDDEGQFSQVLTLNSDIDEASGVGPPGTYWAATVGVRPAVTWSFVLGPADANTSIILGDGPHTIVDPTPRAWSPLQGTAATVDIDGVTTGAPGTDAAVTNEGTSADASLHFTIPRGDQGDPLITRRVWAHSGTTGLTRIPISHDTGDDWSHLASVTVVDGALTFTSSPLQIWNNRRSAFVLDSTAGYEDSEIRSIWMPPSVFDGAKCTSQQGHVHRASATGAIVVRKIQVSLLSSTSMENWAWDGSGLSFDRSANSPGSPWRQPHVLGYKRVAGTPGQVQIFVDNTWGLKAGDQVTVAGTGNTEFDATFTLTGSLYPTPAFSLYETVLLANDATHTTAVARTAAGGLVRRVGPASGFAPGEMWPAWVASRVIGNLVQVKWWAVGSPEPDWGTSTLASGCSWELDLTGDAHPIPTSGMCGVLNNHLKSYGTRNPQDGVIVSGSATLTSASAAFTSGDVGQPLTGQGIPAGATIASYQSATQVTMSAPATQSLTGLDFAIGATTQTTIGYGDLTVTKL